MRDILVVDDFSHVIFQNAFKQYFEELGIKVNDWEGLFEEITKEGGNKAYIRINEDETRGVGLSFGKDINNLKGLTYDNENELFNLINK